MTIHPGLIDKARRMECAAVPVTDRFGLQRPAEQCPDCEGTFLPGLDGRLSHLMTEHGWRMDGRRFDNRNQLLEEL
jgi:hypothetical protein